MVDLHHHYPIRMLCRTATAGGVIGCSGTFVKHLERVTGARIRFGEPIPNCVERVISVTGDTLPKTKVELNGEKWSVSPVQEGLVKVFERVLKLEGSEGGGGVVGCRLLVGLGQVAGVIEEGGGGNVIGMIERRCGSKIRIMQPGNLPDCAFPGDELIQKMGKVVAVKKSSVAVAGCLQAKPPVKGPPKGVSSYEAFPGNFTDYSSIARPVSVGNDRILSSPEASKSRIVEFRLLCSNDRAKGVIGLGGTLVKALEEETGASIKFSDSVVIPNERVVTISALERPEPLYSAAQIAVIRVFSRSIEVGDRRVTGDSISAQLLVSSNQISCLIDTEGMISSDISNVTGVQMWLLESTFAAKNDNILQIYGLYENVKSALFQITGRLRDNLLPNIVPDGAEPKHNAYSAHHSIGPYEREKVAFPGSGDLSNLSSIDYEKALIQEMGQLEFLEKSVDGEDMVSVGDTSGGSATSENGLEQASVEPAVLTYSTEEFKIPEQVFDCVYGGNGHNLA